MHVLIFEPNHSGHRLTTVRVLLDSLLELADEYPDRIKSITVATTPTSVQSEEFQNQLAPISSKFNIRTVPNFDFAQHPLRVGLSQFRNLRNLLNSGDFDHAYAPYADALLQIQSLASLIPFWRLWPANICIEAQLMHSSFAYSHTKRNRQLLSLFAIKHPGCERVHLNDPLAIAYLKKNSPHSLRHTELIPDPITQTTRYEKAYAREQMGLPQDCSIIGCVGVINKRKGVDTLLQAFAMAELPEKVCLLLAGKADAAIQTMLKDMSDPRITVINRYISEDELSYTLSAADLIATPYPQVVGSASIVIRAALAQTMVLTNDTGWCGYIVRRFKLGKVAPVSDVQAFSRALSDSIRQGPDYQAGAESAYFCSFNSTTNVHAHWTSLIRKKLHLQEDSKKTSWNA